MTLADYVSVISLLLLVVGELFIILYILYCTTLNDNCEVETPKGTKRKYFKFILLELKFLLGWLVIVILLITLYV